jgi:alkylhydroperoxidase/carboxymuconolactone decarboxylase family protein YurZ
MELAQVRCLARVSACIGSGDETRLGEELNSALQCAIPVPVIREAILQTYLFAGYAATINAFIALNDLIGPNPQFFTEEVASLEDWQQRGTELCKIIYGDQFERLVGNMKRLHPDLAEWMISEGYGKVLSRPFLTPRVRELLIVAMTAVLKVQRQFYSHVRGALHAGASAEELRSVFAEAVPFMHESSVPTFQQIVNDLTGE